MDPKMQTFSKWKSWCKNAEAQKGKLSKRSKQAWLHPGAKALWLWRKVAKTGLAALVDNTCASGKVKREVLLGPSVLDSEVLLTLQETHLGMDGISCGMW